MVDVQDLESSESRKVVRDSMEGLIDDRTMVLVNKVDLQPSFDLTSKLPRPLSPFGFLFDCPNSKDLR